MTLNGAKSFRRVPKRILSFKNFQIYSGKSQDEVKRILEQESRLGVLSAINYIYPFTGQSRPAFDSVEALKRTPERLEFELSLEDLLPSTPAMHQFSAYQTFALESTNNEHDRSKEWKLKSIPTTTSDWLDDSFLEKFILIRPLMNTEVTIEFIKCPMLIAYSFDDIPGQTKSPLSHDITSKANLIKLNYNYEYYDKEVDEIRKQLTDLCHFLKARGFWADAIDPVNGKPLLSESDTTRQLYDFSKQSGTIRNFRVSSVNSSLSIKYDEEKTIPGLIVTNATEADNLIEDLLLLQKFKSRVKSFFEDGIKHGYLTETGEIIDLELANARKDNIFDEDYYTSLENRLVRFMKLYDFLMDNP